jgi:hypothetical protein
METTQTTRHSITSAEVELHSSSIRAKCRQTGDVVELDLPYGVVRPAIEQYLLSGWRGEKEEIIRLLTENLREIDAKAAAEEVNR